jgi:hypothetical protein
LLKRFSEDNLFIHSIKGKQKLKLIKWYKLFQLLPEKKTENGEWTDASSTSGHGREDATNKTANKQSEALQEVEVLDGVKGSPLVLPYMEKKNKNRMTLHRMNKVQNEIPQNDIPHNNFKLKNST